ncbi:MAG: helix-turn-helix domain-containing protein [Nitrososphaerota archaeon]|nr:hypothetical protein [Nitrososphaerales archaeon]MDW8045004.1 helix-turn-helix domain-containing protein [Nitrososphaerota archaeon]
MTNQDISDVIATLEDFGLSTYEAKAYIALAKRGSLPIGELAYHAGIPRTKAYTTVRKLANKKLILILPGKPVYCQIVPMKDSFERIVSQEELRLKKLKKAILKLKRLNEELRLREGVDEATYTILKGRAISSKLAQIIQGVKKYIHCMVDGWGFKLLQDALNTSNKQLPTDIDFKILLSLSTCNIKNHFPPNVELRVSHYNFQKSIFVFDEGQVFIIDGGRGTGLFIQSSELYSTLEFEFFDRYWKDSFPMEDMIPLLGVNGVNELIALMKNYDVYDLFARSVMEVIKDESLLSEIWSKFVDKLKRELKIEITNESLESILKILIVLTHNTSNSKVHSDLKERFIQSNVGLKIAPSVWAFALLSLLNRGEDRSYGNEYLEQEITNEFQELAT